MTLPPLAEFAGSVVQHALRCDGVLGGDRAMLYALDEIDDSVRGGTRLLESPDLQGAVVEGKLLLALSETPRTALCYLSILRGPNGEKVGLQIDARAEGPTVASFGVPLGAREGRPAAEGEMWALNAAARSALGASVPHNQGTGD